MYEKYLDENYKPTPYERVKAHLGTYALANVLYIGVAMGITMLPDKGVLGILKDYILIVLQFGVIWFFYNAVRNNKPAMEDVYAPFLNSALLPKILAIGIVELLINTAVSFATEALSGIPAVGFAAGIILALITTLFLPVKYLFAMNQSYPTATYFKKAVAYMTDYLFKYYGLVLKYVVILFLLLMGMILFSIVGLIIGFPLLMLVLMIMQVEVTEFIINIVPQEWYEGISVE